MIVLGIDPGCTGGLVVVSGDLGPCYEVIEHSKMPKTERDVFDLALEYGEIADFALIERVHSMPKQGVASSFTFGRGYGFLRACLCAMRIPWDDITPQAWQRGMRCLTRGDKNVSKAAAQRLFPRLKITHAIADALLIASYGLNKKRQGAA